MVGASSLLLFYIDRRKNETKEHNLSWQQTVIHHIFQRSSNRWLSFDEIKREYRSEATAGPISVTATELSDEALRRILIRMVSSRVIDQKGGDKYCLSALSEESLEFSMRDAMTSLISAIGPGGAVNSELNQTIVDKFATIASRKIETEEMIENYTVNIIFENQGKLRISDLVLRVSKMMSMESEFVQATLIKIMAKSDTIYTLDGNLYVKSI
jgi:hypothetical protein